MSARNAFYSTAARVIVGDKLALGGTVVEAGTIRINGRVMYRIATEQRRGFGPRADDMIGSLDYYQPSHRLELR